MENMSNSHLEVKCWERGGEGREVWGRGGGRGRSGGESVQHPTM